MESYTTISEASSRTSHIESYLPSILGSDMPTVSTFTPRSDATPSSVNLTFPQSDTNKSSSAATSTSSIPRGILKNPTPASEESDREQEDTMRKKEETAKNLKDKGSIRGKQSSEEFDDLKKMDERRSLFGSSLLY